MNTHSDFSERAPAPSNNPAGFNAETFLADEFLARVAPLILRWALALTILSAVADRFGIWGPPGAANITWGDWPHFVAYTAKVNSFLPRVLGFLAYRTYTGEPPIPGKVVDADGRLLFTRANIMAVQEAFLRTFTTVGYGDIIPRTAQGKLLAICTALLGATHGVTFVALVLQALTQHPPAKSQE
jgi:Ion channel